MSKKRKRPDDREHRVQSQVFSWAHIQAGAMPDLELLYAVPNAGKRSPRLGAYMKAEGLKAGVPDMVLPVARGGYFGLYMELKMPDNRTTPSQKAWLDALRDQGYYAIVVWSFDEAVDALQAYLKMKETRTTT